MEAEVAALPDGGTALHLACFRLEADSTSDEAGAAGEKMVRSPLFCISASCGPF
jgi:hypothetical protein